MSGPRWSVLAIMLAQAAVAHARAPAACRRADVSRPAALDPLFELLRLDRLQRLKAEFAEEKHISLLARPLRQTGTIYFDRSRGIARVTRTPRPERMVLTDTSLRVEKGNELEEIRLDKSKALKAFALIFPALLRGERAELEAGFGLRLRGTVKQAWSLTLTPKDPALCGLIARVVVSGKGAEVSSLQVMEASGDSTTTRLSEIVRNDAVSAAELAQGFGGP